MENIEMTQLINAFGQMMDEKLEPIKQDISSMKEDISGLKQDVSGLKQDVSGLKQDVSGLKQDVSGLKQDVSGLKQDVSGLKQDVSSIKDRLTRLEVTVENDVSKNIQLLAEGHIGLVDGQERIINRLDKLEEKTDEIAETVSVLNIVTKSLKANKN